MTDQFKLTWLHISDIHFGHGGAYARAERREVLAALLEDLRSLSSQIPQIDQIIVSGDIAFSGGALSDEEYAAAEHFLNELGDRFGLDRDAILVTPGNHDVNRNVAWSDHDMRRWLQELRAGHSIEEAFASDIDRGRMESRMANYLRFSANYGPAFEQDAVSPSLFWTTLIEARDDLRVRISGGNTALLSQGDDDEGKLQVGLSQLREILRPEGDQDVTVFVTHHPLEWCRDFELIEPRVRRWVDVHLCGHVHRAQSERRERGGGGNIVQVVAGALHEYESAEQRGTMNFTYSVASLYADAENDLWLRVWPRRWTQANAGFRVDPETVPDGQFYVDHRVAERRRDREPPPSAESLESTTTAATELLWKVSERSRRRIGARRTAYPLDMSIAELFERGLFVETEVADIADGSRLTTSDLARRASGNTSILLLGEPGSGKSVIAYGLLQRIRQSRPALAIRPSDMIDLLGDAEGKSDLSLALQKSAHSEDSGPVIIVDGLDESLGEVDNSSGLLKAINQLNVDNPIIVTCRRREFEDQLAREARGEIFDSIYVIQDWNLEREFSDFVGRLVRLNLLESAAITDMVRASQALSSLVKRPLFARMLTFLSRTDVSAINGIVDLYSEYIDRLGATSDIALLNANCRGMLSSRKIWVEAAWVIFANGLLHEDRFSLGAVVALLSDRFPWDSRCVSRSLSQLCDQWRVAGRIWTRFVHYSFFEYLVACRYLDQVIESIREDSSQALAQALNLDLTPEIRHFLVGELRSAQISGYTKALVRAYHEAKVLGLSDAQVRTTGNLIAYLVSRVAPDAQDALRELFLRENDLFLQQSLLWGLCHIGDNTGLEEFISRSRASAEWRSWNRGYLMYYYGDLDRREDPPYIDHDRRRAWGRTRERSINLMSSAGYLRDIKPQRCFLDLYSLYDYALWRGETFNQNDAKVTANVLSSLWQDSGIKGELLLQLQAMHAVVCGPWMEEFG